jgi:L-ascorbate metabolism protein UlaG (beta-lactamase superfamily)
LALQWLGTSGFRLTYEDFTILIDPYATRVPLRRALGGARVIPDRARIDRFLPRADAILVGHTHFDHAMDAPVVARRDGCRVYGSRSMVTLMAAHRLRAAAVEVEPYRVYDVGPARVTFVPSRHSKLVLGLAVPAAGEITCEHFDGLACRGYRCGQVFGIHIEVGGMRFYHQGSADLVEEAMRHKGIDVLLTGIAGRGFTPDYTDRVIRALDPACVVPHHHDDFFRGLEEPMRFSLNVNLASFVDEVAATSRTLPVVTLDPLQTAAAG